MPVSERLLAFLIGVVLWLPSVAYADYRAYARGQEAAADRKSKLPRSRLSRLTLQSLPLTRPRKGVEMFLSDFSIKRPVSMVVIIIMLMCLGLLALKNLRVNQIPDVEQPVIVVTIPYPGASPETVEREIINRIEKQFLSISGVYQIRATASESNAQIVVIFNFKKNMVEAAQLQERCCVFDPHLSTLDTQQHIVPRQLALANGNHRHQRIS